MRPRMMPSGVTRSSLLRTGAGALASGLLAACGPFAGGGQPPASPVGPPITLRFVPNSARLEESQQIAAQFQTDHPSIAVAFESVPGDYAEKITALQAGGSLQDVIVVADVYTRPFAAQRVLINLEPLANRDPHFSLKDIYPAMLGLGRATKPKPGLYALAWTLGALVLYYNKNLFRAAGVDVPKPTWAVADLVAAAQKLTRNVDDPATAQYGITLSWSWWAEYVPWMRGYGGDMVSADGRKSLLDDAQTIDGIQAMTDLVTRYRVAPPPDTSFGGDPFQLGRVAMMAQIRASSKDVRRAVGDQFEWDVEVRPAFPKKRVTGAGTQGHGITTQSKYADPCWELTKYFVTPAAQRIFAANYSVVPVLMSMRSDPGWRGLPPPPSNNDAFVQAADAGTLPPEFPVECGSVYTGDVQKTMDEAITKILRGELNAASALKAAAAHINACMAGSP